MLRRKSRIAEATPSYPRCLLIDATRFGGGSATGEIKSAYFAEFGDDRLLHLFAEPDGRLRLARVTHAAVGDVTFFDPDGAKLLARCRAFQPEVVLYRPAPDYRDLHEVAMRLIQELGKPWVVWMMDDWPERLRVLDHDQFKVFDRDLRELLDGAADRFAISEAMADAFGDRYGVPFEVFRNGVSPAQWGQRNRTGSRDGTIRIRYAGSLAPDTTADSVYDVATVVDEIAFHHPVELEIRTQPEWHKREAHHYGSFRHVSFSLANLDLSDYHQWLTDADILLIAYNFDQETIRYLGYSFGNKIPEYLASGAAVLAYGPSTLASVSYLRQHGIASIVDQRDTRRLSEAIVALVTDQSARSRLGEAGRAFAWEHLNLDRQRASFVERLRAAAGKPAPTGQLTQSRRAGLSAQSSVAEGNSRETISTHHRGIDMDLEHRKPAVAVDRPAVVLGNGPSLKGFDFGRFKQFDVFGMNAAYRYWDQIGWYPRYYCCLDQVVGMSHADEIARLIRNAPKYGIEQFLLRRNLIDQLGADIENADRIVDFDRLCVNARQFATLPLTTGSHTLIWAASLGYRHIYVMGVDCNYVEIVPGAERREGIVLEITNKTENPNYFFSGYQQVGDKYNIPNSASPEHHVEAWRAAATPAREYGAAVLNANLQSRVDAYDFCRFDDVESGGPIEILPRGRVLKGNAYYAPSELASIPFERADKVQVNECHVVFNLLNRPGQAGVMLDVGAHRGGSLEKFAEAGWNIYAFEPDSENRKELTRTFGSRSNVVISDEAISDRAAQGVPFFASDESTGISGLSAFRETHREVARVNTVTLNDIVARHSLDRVDFLKADVEGFEMAVLRGLDFARVKPRAVEVEFEDSRATGHTSHDLACFLMQQGYTVYVSQWHPVERYGVTHSWECIKKYPCDIPPESWGNLLAFIQDPTAADLVKALRGAVDRPVRFENMPDAEVVPAATIAATKSKKAAKDGRRKSVQLIAGAALALVILAVLAAWALPIPGVLLGALAVNLLVVAAVAGLAYKLIARQGQIERRRGKKQRKKIRRELNGRLDKLTELVEAQNKAFSRFNGANASRVRVHNRLLADYPLQRLERHWAPLLGAGLKRSGIAYVAHQMCLAEDRCAGRLAATIETMLLRLMALRSLKQPQVHMLEIGALFGLGAGLLHRYRGPDIARLRVTLIDPLNGYYGAGEPDPVTGVTVSPETLMYNMGILEVPSEDIRVLRGSSIDPEVVAAAKQNTYDLLVIGGGHSGTGGVERDVALYCPMVRPGGIVLFNDYGARERPEIKPAVDALMANTAEWEWLGSEWRTGVARKR